MRPENRISKPTLTVRPDFFISCEGQRTRAKTPEDAGLRGTAVRTRSQLFVGVGDRNVTAEEALRSLLRSVCGP